MPLCKEWDWSNVHQCGPLFLCRPDDYEFGEDDREVYAQTPEKAAIKFAEGWFFQGNYFQDMTVHVVDTLKGKDFTFEITVESVPYFSADPGEVRDLPAEPEEEEAQE
jgi:hypothetical protein